MSKAGENITTAPTDLDAALQELDAAKQLNATMIKNWMAQCQRAQALYDQLEQMKKEMAETYAELERYQKALISSEEKGREKEEKLRSAASRMRAGPGSHGVNDFKKNMEAILQER